MNPHPKSVEELSLQWLNDKLADELGEISSFSALGMAGSGFLSTVERIGLQYREVREDQPATLILKTPSTVPVERAEGDHFDAYRKEVHFYRHFANENPLRPPRHYYSDLEDNVCLILMEDLAGCRFVDQIHGASIEDSISVVSALANMHAEYWRSPILREHPLVGFEDYARIYPPRIATGKPLLVSNFGHLYAPEII